MHEGEFLTTIASGAALGLTRAVLSADDSPAGRQPATEGDAMSKRIDDLRWRPRWVSHLGCVTGCLEYLGSDISWARLYGGTGRPIHLLRGPVSTVDLRAPCLPRRQYGQVGATDSESPPVRLVMNRNCVLCLKLLVALRANAH